MLRKQLCVYYLPLWVVVFFEGAMVRTRKDHQGVNLLHGGPGPHNTVRRTEWKIMQDLVHGVTRCPIT